MKNSSSYARWPKMESEWWYLASSVVIDGAPFHLIFLVFKQSFLRYSAPGISSLFAAVSGAPMVHGFASITDLSKGTYRFREQTTPPLAFTGESFSGSYSFCFGDWLSEEHSDGFFLKMKLPVGVFELTCSPTVPRAPIFHGSHDAATLETQSRGYAYPHIQINGVFLEGGDKRRAATGYGWYECGSSCAVPRNFAGLGCEWAYLLFDDWSSVMIFIAPWQYVDDLYGVFIDSQGISTPIRAGEFEWAPCEHWTSPFTYTTYPIAWRLRLAREGIDVVARASIKNQEVDGRKFLSIRMWFGGGFVEGVRNGLPLTGKAYFGVTRDQSFLQQFVLRCGDFFYRYLPFFSKRNENISAAS